MNTITSPAQTNLPAEEELDWLALRMTPGLGARQFGRLIERFRTPRGVLRATAKELEACGLAGGLARSITSGCGYDEAVEQQRACRREGVFVIPMTDPRYPDLLGEIYDPPPVLFARGRTELLREDAVSMVGTRRPTAYGTAVAERISADLAAAGLVIVSGMARGIDTAAHQGALQARGATIAVLGCGVDVVYPTENRKLADRIAREGLLVSEFPMGTPGYPQNFPVRNRIVSGLSLGVIVVEGAQYSGSGITARLAMEQAREVFAVPGNITSRASWGPNLLIKQGARLIQEWNDVIEHLPAEVRRRLAERCRTRLDEENGQPSLPMEGPPAETPQGELARWVLERLPFDQPRHLDDLLETLDFGSPSELVATLFELEMMGLVRQMPGKNFIKVW